MKGLTRGKTVNHDDLKDKSSSGLKGNKARSTADIADLKDDKDASGYYISFILSHFLSNFHEVCLSLLGLTQFIESNPNEVGTLCN